MTSDLFLKQEYLYQFLHDKCLTFNLENGQFNINNIITFVVEVSKLTKFLGLKTPNQPPNHGKICLQCGGPLCQSMNQFIIRHKGVLFIDQLKGMMTGDHLFHYLLCCCSHHHQKIQTSPRSNSMAAKGKMVLILSPVIGKPAWSIHLLTISAGHFVRGVCWVLSNGQGWPRHNQLGPPRQ